MVVVVVLRQGYPAEPCEPTARSSTGNASLTASAGVSQRSPDVLGCEYCAVMATPLLGKYGLCAMGDYLGEGRAKGVERLGYGTAWFVGHIASDLELAESALRSTESLVVGTAVINIWANPVQEIAQSYHRIEDQYPARFILGVGAGRPGIVGEAFQKPYTNTVAYVERLVELGVPGERILLAAIRPRMLRYAAGNTAGSIPGALTPKEIAGMRESIGPAPLIVAGVMMAHETDPAAVRPAARSLLSLVKTLEPGRFDLGGGDFQHLAGDVDPSDDDIDALITYGGPDKVAAYADALIAAGADHVFFQNATADPSKPELYHSAHPVGALTALAVALGLTPE